MEIGFETNTEDIQFHTNKRAYDTISLISEKSYFLYRSVRGVYPSFDPGHLTKSLRPFSGISKP